MCGVYKKQRRDSQLAQDNRLEGNTLLRSNTTRDQEVFTWVEVSFPVNIRALNKPSGRGGGGWSHEPVKHQLMLAQQTNEKGKGRMKRKKGARGSQRRTPKVSLNRKEMPRCTPKTAPQGVVVKGKGREKKETGWPERPKLTAPVSRPAFQKLWRARSGMAFASHFQTLVVSTITPNKGKESVRRKVTSP